MELLEDRTMLAAAFSDFVDPNPSANNGFGNTVVALSTGNVVITSPYADVGGTDTGAVYLFNGATGVLISTLTGSTDNDNVGRDGVTALTNGNYVVNSALWDNGAATNAGAVTFGDGSTGVSGIVSDTNSLVGSTANDQVGQGDDVTALMNGNYVVRSQYWDNDSVSDAGAVTFGNGTTGVSGEISVANSLIGSTANDFVGSGGVTALTNGHYVVGSSSWDNGNVTNVGAVTFGDGTTGVKGLVSAANSLVGSVASDEVGSGGVTALTNGNYVVGSSSWDSGNVTNVGAVTFGDGTTGVKGIVSSTNSLVGSTSNDKVGQGDDVTALKNGNYVVRSQSWDNGAATDAGAVTFGNGTTGVSGVVSTANSLVGSTANDFVGSGGVTALTNGNYVVSSSSWDNGAATDAGAVTFGNGTTGVKGLVSSVNSLVGASASDQVGSGGVTALTNGNYVVSSWRWTKGAATNAGAVTFGVGTTGVSGVVSVSNSLVGSTANDFVGGNGVTVLTNGNYVVSSSGWDKGNVTNAGAVTFGDGTTGVKGIVSSTNSLVGSTSNDSVGILGVTALTNGNYVVRSYAWDNGKGAVTFGNGSSGEFGVVSAANSLVGSTSGDKVGNGNVTVLTNGNYVVSSPDWDNGAATDAGAVTLGNGIRGVSGFVSAANSLLGATSFDRVGYGDGVTALTNGNYVVISPDWDNGNVTNAGAVTFGNGTTGARGFISAANSVIGVDGSAEIDIEVDDINNTYFAIFKNEEKVHVVSQGEDYSPGNFDYFVDPNPSADNGFGDTVVSLSTGNVVITAPYDDAGGTDAGAVYLFDGATKELLSTLVGSTANDQVGDGGVTALTNGNYVVRSYLWDNGAATDAGAVTFGDGTTGVSGMVSAANSLVGSTEDDEVGRYVTALTNGNYLVHSPSWDNGAATDAGAVTFGNGTTGVSGVVSAANSLVGSTADDDEGRDVTVLTNGNYVVRSSSWDNGAATNAGAVTFGNGTTGVSGVISAANSLVGSTANDFVGSSGVRVLTNGNYVVRSSSWDNGAATNAGAVTFGDGTTGVSGIVSDTNSLVGSTSNDFVGRDVRALTNGNYVVLCDLWDNGAATDAGAVTFGDGTTGVSGVVSADNSLVGSTAYDDVGNYVTELTNGNYVVRSQYWDNGAATNAGAVTFGNGTTGVSGVVSAANSLVGSTSNDYVGYYVTALTNGNYVVSSQSWNNGAATDAGAVTFGNGTTGVSGVVSAANSLVGSTSNDQVGIWGVTALTNGNYVVSSQYWNNGAATDAGAVTFGNGTTGVSGVVSAANSLVGSTSNDQVGIWGVTALTNGNYVVRSSGWDNGNVTNAGAVTFGDGTTGVSGMVSAANSLVGSTANDDVGRYVTALTNGNYVVSSQFWDNGAATEAGAVTFGNGTTGVSGVVSVSNSLVGSTANDFVGSNGVTVLTNGNYVVRSQYWDNGAATNAGAVTFGNGTTGVSGVVSAANSLVGSTEDDEVGYDNVVELTNGNYVVRSQYWDNGAATEAGAVTFGNGTTGVQGEVSATNSLVGSTSNDYVGYYVTALTNGNYVVHSQFWDNGNVTNAGAATFGNGTTGVSGVVSAANSLVGATSDDRISSNGVTALTNGNYVVRSRLWDNGNVTNAGAVTFGNGTTGARGFISAANSVIGVDGSAEIDIEVDDINNTYFAIFKNEEKVHVVSQGEDYSPGNFDYFVDPNPSADNGFGDTVVSLSTGNVVITAPYDDAGGTDAGAVYLFDGATKELLSTLVGSTANDQVGDGGVTALTNGNYVVSSQYWDNGNVTNAGAATFGNGTTGVSGVVSAANSLVGATSDDRISSNGVTALTNGNYVVRSRLWDNGNVTNVGAATFGDGTTGVSGVVSADNSLVGSTSDDYVGRYVTALTNGNYVVRSRYWDNGNVTNAGAATFGDGTTGVQGEVSATNSLVGSTSNDYVGYYVTALTNGNYVVHSQSWDNGAATDAGAATFGNGTTGVSGVVSADNSLVGSTANDQVGSGGVTALTNGNYVVHSQSWDNGAATDTGAMTFGNGTTGVSGVVSTANSLVGSTANDFVGSGGVTALTNGNYVVSSSSWDNGAVTDAGAMTFGNGTTGVSGVVSTANSLVGSTANDFVGSGGVTALTNGNYVVISPDWDNGLVVDAGAVTFGDGTTGVTGRLTSNHSVAGLENSSTTIEIIQDDNNNTFTIKNLYSDTNIVGSQTDGFPSVTLDAISDFIVGKNASEKMVSLTGITASGYVANNLRVTVTSSNAGLIPDPTVTYTSAENTGHLAFTPVVDQLGIATITVTVEDSGLDGDLSTTEDNGLIQRTFDVTVSEFQADIDLRVASTPTSLLPNGEVSQLPDNQNWVAEWSTFWVEIWVTTQHLDSLGFAKVVLDLSYQTDYTSATEIEFGPAFTQNQSGTINDLTGAVENLSAETTIADLGINNQLLFAQIKFVPQVDDQVYLDLPGRSIGPQELEIQMLSALVDLGNAPNLAPVIAPSVGSSIWANPFDLNDDDKINFRDLMLFASAYGKKPSETNLEHAWFTDFDQNDRVNFRDLMLFASNYSKRKVDGDEIYYPDNYPDAWDNPLLVSIQPQEDTKAASLTQAEADQVLANAIGQVSEKLTPEMSQALSGVEVKVVDLAGATLGRAVPGTIYLDVNAAGYGWFVDSTPLDHSEFAVDSQLSLIALPDSAAAGRIDLWTVILHELGHLAGYEHEAEGVMEETLAPGVRKLAEWEETTDLFFASVQEEAELLPF